MGAVQDETLISSGGSTITTSNPLLRIVLQHYGSTHRERTPAQLESEKWLIPNLVPFNRWLLFPAAVLFQFCCGSLYAWSVYNTPIDILMYGKDYQITPITFYIAVGFFGLSAAVMGPWLERNGPRTAGLLGSSLFLLGNMLTALALHLQQMWLVFVGYGMIGGFGLGLCYISPVSALQKWFPDRRGLGSGFAVCGFGAGSIALALVPLPLSEAVGLPLTFVVLGCCFFVLMAGSSMILRTPPPGFTIASSNANDVLPEKPSGASPSRDLTHSNQINLSLIQSLTSTEFRLMYFMFFANAVFGLVVISRLSNMIRYIFNADADFAAMIVSVNGGFNLFGRLFFSVISDYIGRKPCYLIMLSFQLVILGCFSTITESGNYWAFVITMWILTACYGGGFGVIPAFLTDMFGPSNIGACHGVILTAWSLAGVGGGLLFTAIFNTILAQGYTKSDAHPYNVNVWWIFGIVVLGWFSFQFLKVSVRDRLAPKVPGELVRLRIGSRLLRVLKSPKLKLEYLTHQQEEEEWQAYLASRSA